MIELAQALARTAITIRPRLSLSQDLRLRPRLNRCLLGLGPPRRFPLGVSRALVLLGLALHSPLPCLQNLFLLIHLSRYRLRDHHLCSLSGHRVRVVRRQSGPGSELEGSHGAHDATSCFLGVRIGYFQLSSIGCALPSAHSESACRLRGDYSHPLYHYFQQLRPGL